MVGAIVLVTAAAPFAGANAGVAVWGAIAFAVAWLRMNRIPLTARTVAWTGAVVVLLVGALAAVDLLGSRRRNAHRAVLPPAGAGWIGRCGAGAAQGAQQPRLRDADARIRGWRSPSRWPWASRDWSARDRSRAALSGFPAYAGALVGVVVGSVVALLTEDSGVVMPALMLLTGALPALYLALREPSASAGDSTPTSEEHHV